MNRRKRNLILAAVLLFTGIVGAWITSAMARLEHRVDELSHAQLVTNAVAIAGKHVVIYAPPAEKANAERLIPMADDAVEYYAQNLNVPVPDEPFPIYLFETIREYEHAANVCNLGRNKANLAFSIGGQAFIYVQPRPGQTIVGNGSMLEELTAHELCHTLHERLFPGYDSQPLWLTEGVAEVWGERVLSRFNTVQANPGIRFSSRIVVVRRALQSQDWIPLAQLLQLSGDTFADKDNSARGLRYAESFALVHMLDDPRPENATRRATFQKFMRFVNNLDGDDTEDRANARFQEVFGGAHLPELEAETIHQVQTEVTCPWEVYTNEIRMLPDGTLQAESFSDGSALAFAAKPVAFPFRLHALADILPVGSGQADLLFGRTAHDDYYVLAYGKGFLTLLHHAKEYETLASAPCDPNLFTPGPHLLEADIDAHYVHARVDGKINAIIHLPNISFPKGQWGLGVYDGRIIFRNASAKSFHY